LKTKFLIINNPQSHPATDHIFNHAQLFTTFCLPHSLQALPAMHSISLSILAPYFAAVCSASSFPTVSVRFCCKRNATIEIPPKLFEVERTQIYVRIKLINDKDFDLASAGTHLLELNQAHCNSGEARSSLTKTIVEIYRKWIDYQ
jgi:hypothetical protein